MVALVLVGIGYVLGRGSGRLEWRDGTAVVGDRLATIRSEGWDYGVSDSVAWIDGAGTHHDDGWPECLEVPVGTSVDAVRFATVNVNTEDIDWREVVLVDCQQR